MRGSKKPLRYSRRNEKAEWHFDTLLLVGDLAAVHTLIEPWSTPRDPRAHQILRSARVAHFISARR